jgi:hypothetical protein
MMPALHETLRRRRLEMGMGEGRASTLLGITSAGYHDLEAHKDEWEKVVPLYIVLFACRLFAIDILQFVPDQTGVKIEPNKIAGDIIRQRREALGLSTEEFANRCGFHPVFTSHVETGLLLTWWPFEVTRIVCRELGLDLKTFLQYALMAPQ